MYLVISTLTELLLLGVVDICVSSIPYVCSYIVIASLRWNLINLILRHLKLFDRFCWNLAFWFIFIRYRSKKLFEYLLTSKRRCLGVSWGWHSKRCRIWVSKGLAYTNKLASTFWFGHEIWIVCLSLRVCFKFEALSRIEHRFL